MKKSMLIFIFPIFLLTTCSHGKNLIVEIEKNPNVLRIKKYIMCKDFSQDCTITIEMKDHSDIILGWNYFDFLGTIRFHTLYSVDGYSYYLAVYNKKTKRIVSDLFYKIYPINYKNLEQFVKKRNTLNFLTHYSEIRMLLNDIPILSSDEKIELSDLESRGESAENWLKDNFSQLYCVERKDYIDIFYKYPTPNYLK